MAGEAEAQIEEVLNRKKSGSQENQDTFADVASSFDPLGLGPDFHSDYGEQLAADMEKAKLGLQLQQYKDAKQTAAENKQNWKGAYNYLFGKADPSTLVNAPVQSTQAMAPSSASMGGGAGMGGSVNQAAYDMLGQPRKEEKDEDL